VGCKDNLFKRDVDMSQLLPLDRAELRSRLITNREDIRRVLQEDPALLDYLLGDIELKRKYVKMPDQVERDLAKRSRELGLAEGVLLGLGAALLLLLLAEIFKS